MTYPGLEKTTRNLRGFRQIITWPQRGVYMVSSTCDASIKNSFVALYSHLLQKRVRAEFVPQVYKIAILLVTTLVSFHMCMLQLKNPGNKCSRITEYNLEYFWLQYFSLMRKGARNIYYTSSPRTSAEVFRVNSDLTSLPIPWFA